MVTLTQEVYTSGEKLSKKNNLFFIFYFNLLPLWVKGFFIFIKKQLKLQILEGEMIGAERKIKH